MSGTVVTEFVILRVCWCDWIESREKLLCGKHGIDYRILKRLITKTAKIAKTGTPLYCCSYNYRWYRTLFLKYSQLLMPLHTRCHCIPDWPHKHEFLNPNLNAYCIIWLYFSVGFFISYCRIVTFVRVWINLAGFLFLNSKNIQTKATGMVCYNLHIMAKARCIILKSTAHNLQNLGA